MEHDTQTPAAVGVRIWETTDIPMMAEWWTARDLPGPCADRMPPCGVIAGPILGNAIIPHAAACLHLTTGGTGIAFLDWLAVAPHIHPAQAVRAVDAAIQFLQDQARHFDYGEIIAIMRDERLARLAEKRHGFTTTTRGVLAQWKPL